MNILDVLMNAQGGGAVRELGQQFGLDESQVGQALSALVPALAAGFQRNASAPGGLESLLGALGSGQHSQYLESASALAGATGDGNGILGHVFGSKDVSRQVASQAAARTGLDPAILRSLLPVVAAMMMGALSKGRAGASGFGANTAAVTNDAGASIFGMLTPMLDQNGDGSIVDDVVGMLGKFLGGR